MANYWALSAGDWSNVSNWLTGTSPGEMAGALPGPEDDVFANNRVIHIDGNFAAKRITNLSAENIAARGGYFTMEDGITLSAYVHGSLQSVTSPPWTACLQFLSAVPASATLVGSLCAGDGIPGTYSAGIDGITGNAHLPSALINFGDLTIIGNCEGGTPRLTGTFPTDARMGVVHNYGNLTIYGDVSATRINTTTANVHYGFVGIRNIGAGNITVYGNVVGGVNFQNHGIYCTGTGTVRVFGTVRTEALGSSQEVTGILTNSTTSLFISGDVYGQTNTSTYTTIRTLRTSGPAEISGTVFGPIGNSNTWLIEGTSNLIKGPIIVRNAGTAVTNSPTNSFLRIEGGIEGSGGTGLSNFGTVELLGNVYLNTARGIVNSATATLTMYGSVSTNGGGGASGANNRYAIANAGIIYLSGNVTGGTYNNDSYGIVNTGTGSLYLTGNSYGGSRVGGSAGRGNGIQHNSIGECIINGNVYGGFIGGSAYGITINSSNPSMAATTLGTVRVTIYGNVYGGDGNNLGALIDLDSVLTVVGDVIGGDFGTGSFGASNTSTATLSVIGTAKGGNTSAGISNNSSGTVYATRAVGNDAGPSFSTVFTAKPGIQNNSANGRVFVEEVVFGSQGATPVSGPIFMVPKSTNITVLNTGPTTGYTSVTLFRSINFPGFAPEPRDVRAGLVYGAGEFTGTMIVPTRESVQLGVPVDNTKGLAALSPISVWNFSRNASLTAGSIGQRVRNALTTQAAGTILASFNLSGASAS